MSDGDYSDRVEYLSGKVIDLAEEFDDCPPMQAILHGSFTMYLYGNKGIMQLVLLAASIGTILDKLREDSQ